MRMAMLAVLGLWAVAGLGGVAWAEEIPEGGTPLRAKVALAELVGSAWLAEDIGGAGVVDRVSSTLGIQNDRIAGDGGCNRYNGSAVEKDGRLQVGPLAATRRMCPEAVSDQEMRFFVALEKAAGFELDRDRDLLYLVDAEGAVLVRFSRLEGEA